MKTVKQPRWAALITAAMVLAASGVFAQNETIFISPPDLHKPVIAAIASATSSIEMTMFHLSDPAVILALIAAQTRGVEVRLILDGKGLQKSGFAAAARQLRAKNIQVRASSPAFTITHEKSLVIDRKTALIMSMNMTNQAATTRDYGIITANGDIITEWENVFDTDWLNAQNGTGNTPTLSQPNLLWSPKNSETKLATLAQSATQSLIATVENLGDPAIQDAMIAAAKNGAQVRLIVPMCVEASDDPTYNYQFFPALLAGNVEVKVMPSPSSAARPYMHGKMMVADGRQAYIGSVNYSENSTQHARELGILFSNPAFVARLSNAFESDWQAAAVPQDPSYVNCPKASKEL